MIAISGYTGFIGQALLKHLAANKCLCLGRTHEPGEYQYQHIDLKSLARPSFAVEEELLSTFAKVETLVHLAAKVHVMNDNEKSESSAEDSSAKYKAVNTDATLTLAKLAASAGVKRFVFLSSIKVHGESTPPGRAFRHDDELRPCDAYSQSKADAEYQLMELAKSTSMDVVIIRPPLVYGEGVKANFAALLYFTKKHFFNPFILLRNNKRSFVSVDNLCDLIVKCVNHPNAANKAFLVSDKQDLSTAELVSVMIRTQKTHMLPIPIPYFIYELMGRLLGKSDMVSRITESLLVDMSFTEQSLNWSPPQTMTESIEKMYLSRINNERQKSP